jgi:hypothetical protein
MKERFNQFDDEYIKFDHVAGVDRLSERPDLCAFLLLERLVPGRKGGDIIGSAEHDQIWLDVNIEKLSAVASDADICTLVRCGVRYDSEFDSLAMFA